MRIKFKVFTFVYKSLQGQCPKYIKSIVELYVTEKTKLRSNQIYQRLKSTKNICSTLSGGNELPYNIKQADSIDSFKSKLKTFLFDLF